MAKTSTTFRKGQSGNPGGRPKVVGEVRELARKHTTDAINTLAKICKSDDAPEAARVSAANAILDRGYGKPTQPVQQVKPLNQMSEEEILALLGGEPDPDELSALASVRPAGSA